MNKRNLVEVILPIVLFFLLGLQLAACGTLEVGVEPLATSTEEAEQNAKPEISETPQLYVAATDIPPTPPVAVISETVPAGQVTETSEWIYQANDHSSSPAISADRRYIAFQSGADNLIPNDSNNAGDVFVFDREMRTIELISLTEDNEQAADASGEPGISADGRWVVFSSIASNLAAGDDNEMQDVFLRDRQTGSTILVSKSINGGTGNMMSMEPVISSDGRWIAFTSYASDLVPEIDEHTGENIADTNGMGDIYVYDRQGGGIRRASLSSEGAESNHNNNSPGISADGRWVVFWSMAGNLVPEKDRGIYLHDRSSGITSWIADGLAPTISPDGRWIGFLTVLPGSDVNTMTYAAIYEVATGGITTIGGYTKGGVEGMPSRAVKFSTDAEWLAFQSTFSAPDDPSESGAGEWGQQVWLREQKTGLLTLVSVAPDGLPGNNVSASPSLSADGRWVVFQSFSDNLVIGDDNGYMDIFVYDRETGAVELISWAVKP